MPIYPLSTNVAPGDGNHAALHNGERDNINDLNTRAGTGLGTTRKAVQLAQAMLTGGGTLSYTAGGLSWTQQFITISTGAGPHFAASGFFDIFLPPDGTVISGVGGAVNQTVTARRIPLLEWHALYYILPVGGVSTSLPGNFRLVNYTGPFEVPENWVMVASHYFDSNTVRVANGATLVLDRPWTAAAPEGDTGKRNMALLNGWRAPLGSLSLSRIGQMVCLDWSALEGTVATADKVIDLPIGFQYAGLNVIGLWSNAAPAGMRQLVNRGTFIDTSNRDSGTYCLAFWRTSDPWPATLPGTPA